METSAGPWTQSTPAVTVQGGENLCCVYKALQKEIRSGGVLLIMFLITRLM